MYLILTEPKKSSEPPMKRMDIFWSRIYGSFSKFDQATRFGSFDEAQPTLQKLRANNPWVHAVRAEDVCV
jgi:hypothetical protein